MLSFVGVMVSTFFLKQMNQRGYRRRPRKDLLKLPHSFCLTRFTPHATHQTACQSHQHSFSHIVTNPPHPLVLQPQTGPALRASFVQILCMETRNLQHTAIPTERQTTSSHSRTHRPMHAPKYRWSHSRQVTRRTRTSRQGVHHLHASVAYGVDFECSFTRSTDS